MTPKHRYSAEEMLDVSRGAMWVGPTLREMLEQASETEAQVMGLVDAASPFAAHNSSHDRILLNMSTEQVRALREAISKFRGES